MKYQLFKCPEQKPLDYFSDLELAKQYADTLVKRPHYDVVQVRLGDCVEYEARREKP